MISWNHKKIVGVTINHFSSNMFDTHLLILQKESPFHV
jgi:hypothetical protein